MGIWALGRQPGLVVSFGRGPSHGAHPYTTCSALGLAAASPLSLLGISLLICPHGQAWLVTQL